MDRIYGQGMTDWRRRKIESHRRRMGGMASVQSVMAWYRQDMNTELDSCDVPTKDRSLGLVVNDSGPLVGVVLANYPTDNEPETPLGVMNLSVACPQFGLVTVPKLIAKVETSYTQTLEGTIASHGKTIGIFDRSHLHDHLL